MHAALLPRADGDRPALAATLSTDYLAAGRRLARTLADCPDLVTLMHEAPRALIDELPLQRCRVQMAGAASFGSGTPPPLARELVEAALRNRRPVRHDEGPSMHLALPLRVRGRVQGALYVTATSGLHDDALADTLALVAAQLAAMIELLRHQGLAAAAAGSRAPTTAGAAVVRRYVANDSVFVDGDYLIKGVAGAILWKLLGEQQRSGRTSFSNRELRIDPQLRLPEIGDNLEARLTLLRRRLEAHGRLARIERTGRGRFDLALVRPVQLVEVA
jgi:GNAT superfamily N-acetyltransferase